MEYLYNYLKDLENIPPHIRQEFQIMRDLDEKVLSIVDDSQKATTELFKSASCITPAERRSKINKIHEYLKKGIEISNDKVSRAENVYELVDKQIRRLDSDLAEFQKALAEKEFTKSQKSRKRTRNLSSQGVKMPATAALALALTKNPEEVIDMPVDPNEPVYCICQQVSYGEMVACDNINCPIEWFHFSCMGLNENPKGKWFCPKCLETQNHNQP